MGKNETRPIAVVILAAGQGTRMRSDRAKVLHEVAGRPMLDHVLDAARALRPQRTVVVVGHQAETVEELVGDRAVCALQAEQLGTGHAVSQALGALPGFRGDVVVLYGDTPLITAATLRRLVRAHRKTTTKYPSASATVVSMFVDDPAGYGRIVRGESDSDLAIVEDRDANADQRTIDEVNTGLYCFDFAFLRKRLANLASDNAQGEYYLTDLIAAAAKGSRARCFALEDATEAMGINSRLDLAGAEALLQRRIVEGWMARGVTFLDPSTAYVGAEVTIGADTVVGPNVRLSGSTKIGKRCVLDGSSFLTDTTFGDDVLVRWGTVTDRARVGRGVKLGPYAHLRPEAWLAEDVHIGNFVEVKKSRIGRGSKANHLTYIGDAEIGRGTNIGAGTITCNYDGFDKHPTVIGDGVQIGSDTQLVAPVRIRDGAYVAAGSTVTRDVEGDALAFNQKPQRVRSGWAVSFRKRKAAERADKKKAAGSKTGAGKKRG